jgi:hypothetical protein
VWLMENCFCITRTPTLNGESESLKHLFGRSLVKVRSMMVGLEVEQAEVR